MRNVASIENEMEGGKYFVHDFEIFENISQESRDTVALQSRYSCSTVALQSRNIIADLLPDCCSTARR